MCRQVPGPEAGVQVLAEYLYFQIVPATVHLSPHRTVAYKVEASELFGHTLESISQGIYLLGIFLFQIVNK